MPRVVERPTNDPMRLFDCESTSGGIDKDDRTNGNDQPLSARRAPDVCFEQKLLVGGVGKLLVLKLVQFDTRLRLTEVSGTTSSTYCIGSRGDRQRGSSSFTTT